MIHMKKSIKKIMAASLGVLMVIAGTTGVAKAFSEDTYNNDFVQSEMSDDEQNALLPDDSIEEADKYVQSYIGESKQSDIESETKGKSSINPGAFVIVLDPGHGGEDPGATRVWNGVTYYERDINLKIAQACKQKLEQYAGVEVYLTREDNTSPNMTRGARVAYASTLNCDSFISIHINSTNSTQTSASGAEVIYQNKSYIPALNVEGKELSETILSYLSSIGVKNNGAYTRDSTDGSCYDDGSITDYYGINYYSKLYGFVGIIVEHAYISNPSDCAKYLTNDDSLKAIGEADAAAIADYYGLKDEVIYNYGDGIISLLNSGSDCYEFAVSGTPWANGMILMVENSNTMYQATRDTSYIWRAKLDEKAMENSGIYTVSAHAQTKDKTAYKVGEARYIFNPSGEWKQNEDGTVSYLENGQVLTDIWVRYTDKTMRYLDMNGRMQELFSTTDVIRKNDIIVEEDGERVVTARANAVATGKDTVIEYSWYVGKDNDSFRCIKDWSTEDSITWQADDYGTLTLKCKARVVGNAESELQAVANIEAHPMLKGICQMPYTGEGGGYLIGLESYDNPEGKYSYEMLILDCTLLAQGLPAWIYTTNRCYAEGNCMWTIWQPIYGYYWTLFRIYDENGNMIDEKCYGFQNI